MKSEVPQGSTVSNFLFNIFMNDVRDSIKTLYLLFSYGLDTCIITNVDG